MRSAIVLLERSSSVPKHAWRDPAGQRTLAPFEAMQVIANTWKAHRNKIVEYGSISISLDLDGSAIGVQAVHSCKREQPEFIGVFEMSFVDDDRVKVFLREEECSRQLGSPRRHTHQIALLRPWQPVRILLNGRRSSHSEQNYLLLEYHLTLCADPVSDTQNPTQFVDLQAILF